MWKLIPLPYKLLGAAVLLAGLFATHVYRVNLGYIQGKKDALATVKQQDDARLLVEQAKVSKLEKEIADSRHQEMLARAEEKLIYAKELQTISSRIASGAERMRCPAVTVHTPAAPANPADPSRPAAAEGGYLMPGTVAVIQRIARTDYENVRDYNALANLYNKMREACNRE